MSENIDQKQNEKGSRGRRNTNSSSLDLEVILMDRYGPMLGGSTLRKVLGYPSAAALRMALNRGLVKVPVFEIENRRGRFALTQDVAAWFKKCRAEALQQTKNAPIAIDHIRGSEEM